MHLPRAFQPGRRVSFVVRQVDPRVSGFLEGQNGGLVRLLQVVAGGPVGFKSSNVEADDGDVRAMVGAVTGKVARVGPKASSPSGAVARARGGSGSG